MATLTRSHTAAAELAAERFRVATDLAIEGRSPYPNGAAFVAADLPNLSEILAGYAREHRPVVLVYTDGEERFLVSLTPPSGWRAAIESFFRGVGRALRPARSSQAPPTQSDPLRPSPLSREGRGGT